MNEPKNPFIPMLEQNKHQIWTAHDRGPAKKKIRFHLSLIVPLQNRPGPFKKYPWGSHQNSLSDAILMTTHNIYFCRQLRNNVEYINLLLVAPRQRKHRKNFVEVYITNAY